MRLPRPFYRLPIRANVERLRAEVAALPASAWARHPNDIKGNSAVRLVSVEGGENDDVNGRMLPTQHLQSMPYVRQIMAGFGVVWSRARLLRLAPGATVPEHADINYHWYNRVRLHIPIVTRPEVRFFCDDQSVHMAAGEAWIFDNWRLHRVENFTPDERIHFVADTSGSSAFWRLVAQGEQAQSALGEIPFAPDKSPIPMTERIALAPVMAPAEVDLLTLDLRSELVVREGFAEGPARLARYTGMLESLCRDWRQLYALHGDGESGWAEFEKLRDSIRTTSRSWGEGLMMRTNRVDAHMVLEGRLLRALLSLPSRSGAAPAVSKAPSTPRLKEPVFIIAAPRSGSTLLYETLATSSQLANVGGEAHWMVESMSELRPDIGQVESNRLTAEHATAEVAERIVGQILSRLLDHEGRPLADSGERTFLEKTPKNALRIPFFERIFPDARFVFLWREPHGNLASIIEAWRSGQWKTYNGLKGFDGPWSLLLPPGWRALNGKPLEEIAAWQWQQANSIALDDLQRLPRSRWTVVRYEDLLQDPRATVGKVFDWLGLRVDATLEQRLASALPNSRYTLTAPDAQKWRAHAEAIERVLPSIEAVWQRLRLLQ
jgi:LPS sulfotransferase NodH